MVKEEDEVVLPDIESTESLFQGRDEIQLSLGTGESAYFIMDPSAEDDDTLHTIMARYSQGIKEEPSR